MYTKIFLLFLLILLIIVYRQYFLIEEFSNYYLGSTYGIYPSSETDVLVEDTYPITGINNVSDNGSAQIWKKYPIFEVGSYEQTTNNIRYPDNPDDGRCMPANFCGALYKDKHLKSNVTEQLPPVNSDSGTRVGYFTTDVNMLQFRNNESNILY